MRNLILFALSAVFLSACEKVPEIQTVNGVAQGTTYSVKYWLKNSDSVDRHALKQSIDKELARIDKVMSNYREDSYIAIFNQNKVANIPILLDKEILDVLKISTEVHEKSQGCYDPTIGPLFTIWGFKKDNLRIPTQKQIDEILQSVGFSNKLQKQKMALIKRHPETTVDLSAIGQGYAVAKISDILQQNSINNYLAEIGGEMLVSGIKPNDEKWRVGVERPVPNSQKVSEIITLSGTQKTAIMTSGTYRHYFDNNGKRYSHILDPRTGKPVEHSSVAATVLLPDATYADAWSTALLCLGSKIGLQVANANAIPVIFYDMENQQLVRHQSHSVTQAGANWSIEPNQ